LHLFHSKPIELLCIYSRVFTNLFLKLIWIISRRFRISIWNWIFYFTTCYQQNFFTKFGPILGFHMTSQKWRGGSTLKQNTVIRVSRLFVLCISLVFGGKYMKFRIIFSLQYSISINIFEVDPPSDSLHNAVVKPKNSKLFNVIMWTHSSISLVFLHILFFHACNNK
jgi:hypothetical protein